ncbi:DUF2252 domain-containing protein [Chromobacterium phragmitis]|uniref:DUF2252 domain-containing protein n=1 Tax=Chromobacterium phragmitis TaxID=2202141 RepID=A0A344UJY0_9NEIS|nr:DUF2252 domain-containing protein [Chromobacterium phragmitis]AXE30182.1 DUF2252 domain-containing protein [Chromobacterium phragmitis]AXE35578.1 DUF2252 domain-containing protein [Chromobacterium phragmitis]
MSNASHPKYDQHYADGKARRGGCPRASQSEPSLAPERDVVALVESTSQGRVPALVPLRYARMRASPFAFFRGTAMIQAADLAAGPDSGLRLQICGDAHLMNYGFFASPERQLVFDINDFDETHPGPWEWDLKRLAVSLVLAARGRGFDESAARETALRLAGTYRRRLAGFSQMSQLELWYCRVGFEQLLSEATDEGMRQQLNKVANKARNQTQERLLPKMADLGDGGLRLRDNPPVIFHLDDHDSPLAACDDWLGGDSKAKIQRLLNCYIDTLKEDRRELLQRFRLVDAAFKVVGVGSVGTRCLALLLQDDYDQPLFLQLKEARPSVLEPFTQPCAHGNQGKRVVFGQRLMQATSDLFLGWTQGADDRHFYMRQLRDMKAAPALETFSNAEELASYGQACAWTLARAHAKSGGCAAEIAGYLGQSDKFDQALADYAQAYADQVEKDYALFDAAARSGRLPISQA